MTTPHIALGLDQLAADLLSKIDGTGDYTFDVQTVKRSMPKHAPYDISDSARPWIGLWLEGGELGPMPARQLDVVDQLHLFCLLPRESDDGLRQTQQLQLFDDIQNVLGENPQLNDGTANRAIGIWPVRREFDAADDGDFTQNAMRIVLAIHHRRSALGTPP